MSEVNLLEQYLAELRKTNTAYTPLTDRQIQKKAEQRYQSLYDQNRLSAQQTYDAERLAREQALATQLDQYALQLDQSAKNYRDAQASTIRSALGRGMQRSSYLGATVGNIGIKGNEAQQAILKNQEGTVRNYAAQQQLAATQLANQLAHYDKAQLADQLAYMDELEAREYERAQDATLRAAQIATDIYNAQLYATENNLFGYSRYPSSGSSSGGGSSGSSSSGSNSNPKPPASNTESALDKLLGAVSGTSSSIAKAVGTVAPIATAIGTVLGAVKSKPKD